MKKPYRVHKARPLHCLCVVAGVDDSSHGGLQTLSRQTKQLGLEARDDEAISYWDSAQSEAANNAETAPYTVLTLGLFVYAWTRGHSPSLLPRRSACLPPFQSMMFLNEPPPHQTDDSKKQRQPQEEEWEPRTRLLAVKINKTRAAMFPYHAGGKWGLPVFACASVSTLTGTLIFRFLLLFWQDNILIR